MRLWSLHPRYLDPQGLVAVWREALLARAVIRRRTKGYRHHPQLARFQAHRAPGSAINSYLRSLLAEAADRGYSFDKRKVGPVRARVMIACTSGQIRYEWDHLLTKLRARSPARYRALCNETAPEAHPLFAVRPGPVEHWEKR